MKKILFTVMGLLLPLLVTQAQADVEGFYFGVDLSYVNEVEDCGAVFRENGEVRDPFELFADHGANLVRARLWHNPDWTAYSTFEDVKRTFTRAKAAGMSTLLDIHYSDDWADAGTQNIPAAWEDLSDDELVDAVYQYTYEVMSELQAENLRPDFVQVGNETNPGILLRDGQHDWAREAKLFNSGIQAIRDFAAETDTDPQIILHVAQPENTDWWFSQAEAAGITDFDVIGISFYPQWSTFPIGDMGAQVSHLRQQFGKQVMVLETGYPWTREAVDESANNVLTQGIRGYSFSPEGQRRFMTDLTQSLISNGAIGVVYWEPAWVSTECSTRWGQGSHWENATFFDFQNNNELLEGINFLSANYTYPAPLVDGTVEAEYGEPLVEDNADDVLRDVSALDLGNLYISQSESAISLALTVNGDIFAESGSYLIYVDTTGDEQGATVDVGRRPITVADPYKPEFRLDISIVEDRGTVRASYGLSTWSGAEWEEASFTGGAAVSTGSQSVIELQIPRALLNNPEVLNIGIISTGRGRVRTASDILGSAAIPSDDSEPMILETFFQYAVSG